MSEQIDWQLDERTTICRAGAADFDAVLAVVQDAARRVMEKGIQWKYYLSDEGIQNVRDKCAGVNDREVYLLERQGKPIAAFSLQWDDLDCWPDRGEDGLAGYIHMLTIHRDARHEGLGERILAWAERLIAHRGRDLCRLDCWNGSTFLCAYYPRLGYEVVNVEGAHHFLRNFQKRVRP